jgi:acyl-[acyl-carrier-protein] desaturase
VSGEEFAHDQDPVLEQALRVIAVDEAAHFDFFLQIARINLYYYPEETLRAFVEVMRHFVMPATTLYPNFDGFVRELLRADLFSPRTYRRQVVDAALDALGIASLKQVEAGIRRSREAPGLDGEPRRLDWMEGCDFPLVESAVRALFDRIGSYERAMGLADGERRGFVPHSWSTWDSSESAAPRAR